MSLMGAHMRKKQPQMQTQVMPQQAQLAVMPQQQAYRPQTGLVGAERALEGGLNGAMGQFNQHYGNAVRALGGSYGGGTQATGGFRSKYNTGQSAAPVNTGGNSQYLEDAQAGLREGEAASRADLQAGRNDINQGVDGGMRYMNNAIASYMPYRNQGGQAFNRVSALSGAMGQEHQQAAYDQFTESPGQAWLREQGERAVTRNAAATGGLGGGRVLQELQRQGQGLAAQDFDNYYNRLSGLADVGMRATDAIGGIQQTQGQMENNRGVALAGLQGQMAGNSMAMGQGLSQIGQTGANNQTSMSNAATAANASMSNARLAADTQNKNALANAYMNWGNNTANAAYGTGNTLAGLRTDAGNNIAQGNLGTAQAIGNGQYGAAQDASNIVGGGTNNLSQILGGASTAAANGWGQIANGLSGVNGQIISGLTGTTRVNNPAFNEGTLKGLGDGLGGIGSMITALSDPRLKTNIQKIGETSKGFNLYTWDWNEEGKSLAKGQATVGVMADEMPDEYVVRGDDGYLRVDYSKVYGG